MLISVEGQMVRIAVKGIRETGRNTMGVKLINLSTGDRLQAIAPVINENQETEGEDPQTTIEL
jgi:DNA gyrase subunit A